MDIFWVIAWGIARPCNIFSPLSFPHVFARKTHAHIETGDHPVSEGYSDCGLGEGTAESFLKYHLLKRINMFV